MSNMTASVEHREQPHSRSAGFHLLLLSLGYLVLHGALAYSIPRFEPATHNDDWVYVPPAKSYYETGQFRPHPIAAALAWPQIVAGGWIYAVAGGFRYGLLRDGMVLFGILPVWLMWLLARQLGLSRQQATWAALLLMVNPLTVSLTWSFQTEIPFLTFALTGLNLLLWSAGPNGNRWAVLPACAALLLMSLTRQTGLCLVAASAVALLIDKRWASALFVGLIIPLTLVLENELTKNAELIYLPYAKHIFASSLSRISAKTLFLMLYESLHLIGFLGVFVVPLLLMGGIRLRSARWLAVCGVVMALAFGLDQLTGLTPVLGPYLQFEPTYSLGPRTLEVAATGAVRQSGLQNPVLMSFRLLAVVGGTVLLAELVHGVLAAIQRFVAEWSISPETEAGEGSQGFPDADHRGHVFVSLWLCANLAGVLLTSVMIGRRPFDEYLILALPLAFVLTWPLKPWDAWGGRFAVPSISVVALGLLAYWGTVDYWQWNAARWRAVAKLEEQGIPYQQLDGGYAYNGLHANLSLPADILEFHRQRNSTLPEDWLRNQHRPAGTLFLVGFSPPESSQPLLFREPYSTPLSGEPRFIYVKRIIMKPKSLSDSADSKAPQPQRSNNEH